MDEQPEDNVDERLKGEDTQKYWLSCIGAYERKAASWHSRADTIHKLYMEEADTTRTTKRKFAMLWSNVQTIGPAVYARPPKCVVSRRFGISKQQPPQQPQVGPDGQPLPLPPDKAEIVRQSVTALERSVNVQIDLSAFHDEMMNVRRDRLIAGRGTMWARYKSQIVQGDDGVEQVTEERALTEWVSYKDFGHSEARSWEEVDAVWRKTYLTSKEMKERFGDDVLERTEAQPDHRPADTKEAAELKFTVHEIWCKSKQATIFIAKQAKVPLEEGPPILKLRGFFPCPKPIYATLGGENLIPTPDYVYYQDQAEEINKLTMRINAMISQLKLVGFYPKGPDSDGGAAIERALKPETENVMIPVPSWAGFTERGGASAIQFLPLKEVIAVLRESIATRSQLVADIYQITGISDIMRGDTNANETASAQNLKAQFGSVRLRDTQDDFSRFARDMCEIIAEIISEVFQPQSIIEMTDLEQGPWLDLIKSQKLRQFVVDVETDSTIQPDEDAEKARRIEFMEAFSAAIQQASALTALPPQVSAIMIPMIGDAMMFVVRGFRAGRELEERVEETIMKLTAFAEQAAEQANQPPQPPQPTPQDEIKAQEVQTNAELKSRELDIKEMQALGQQQKNESDAQTQAMQTAAPQNDNAQLMEALTAMANAVAAIDQRLQQIEGMAA